MSLEKNTIRSGAEAKDSQVSSSLVKIDDSFFDYLTKDIKKSILKI